MKYQNTCLVTNTPNEGGTSSLGSSFESRGDPKEEEEARIMASTIGAKTKSRPPNVGTSMGGAEYSDEVTKEDLE